LINSKKRAGDKMSKHKTVTEAFEAEFMLHGLFSDNFSHDVTAFNSTGDKAGMVCDDSNGAEREFVIMGAEKSADGLWEVKQFHHENDGHCDGIDAMNTLNGLLATFSSTEIS
jgi:hypothetical protein